MFKVPTMSVITVPKISPYGMTLPYENREIMVNTLARLKAGMEGHVQLVNTIVSKKTLEYSSLGTLKLVFKNTLEHNSQQPAHQLNRLWVL
jgi:hypothetical protein